MLAVAAAFASGLLAIAQHASCTSAGYQLAVAEREHVELLRAANRAERRVAKLAIPQAALARVEPMKMAHFAYPKQWNVADGHALAAALAASGDVFAVPGRSADR